MQNTSRFFYRLMVNLLLLTLPAVSQNQPKIGLALSGGGAKGFAHIGVLKVLEEAKIPIDCISGTSIGSVVGGLYAIGYSTGDLEELALTTDWNELFSDNVQRSDLGMELKRWDGRYAFTLAIQDRKLQLPSGIIDGQKIFQLLNQLTLAVQHIDDFKQFPIPFSCVAVDIVSGETVTLDHGQLSEAIRASMSIPTVFTPIKIGGHLLADGGIIRNLPAQDVRDLGADIIIGVDVGAPLSKEEELKSFLNIVDQISSFQKAAVNEQQRKLCRYIIDPQTEPYGTVDFDKAAFFIKQGEEAARNILPQLQLLADSLARLGAVAAGIPRPPATDSLDIKNLEIDSSNRVVQRIVKSEMRLKLPQRIAVTDLQAAIDRIYSTQLFSRVTYRVSTATGGKNLAVKVAEKSDKLFRIGFRYDSKNDATILLNTTFQNLGKFGSLLAMDAKLGIDPMLDGQYFLRTGQQSHLGFRGRLNYSRSSLDIFSGEDRVARFRIISYIADLLFGKIFSKTWSLGIGLRGEYVVGEPNIAPPDTPEQQEELLTLYGTWRIDTIDRTVFPTRGVFLNSEIALADKRVLSNRTFHRAYMDFRALLPLFPRLSFLFSTFLGVTSTESDLPIHYFFMLGGMDSPFVFGGDFNSFLALKTQERVGRNAQFYQTGLQYMLPGRKFIQLRWNAGEVFEKFEIDFSENKFITGIGLTAGIDTRFGPVDFTVMGGSRHGVQAYFNVGYKF